MQEVEQFSGLWFKSFDFQCNDVSAVALFCFELNSIVFMAYVKKCALKFSILIEVGIHFNVLHFH